MNQRKKHIFSGTHLNLEQGLKPVITETAITGNDPFPLFIIQDLPDLNARTLHSYRNPHLKLHLPPLLFCFGLNFSKISKNYHFLS